MKRIVRSSVLKLLAVILCIAAVGVSVSVVLETFVRGDIIYMFEDDFQNSYYLSKPFDQAVSRIGGNIVASKDADREVFKHAFDQDMHDARMEYYAVSSDGVVWSNTDNGVPEYYKSAQAHYLYQNHVLFETSLEGWVSVNNYYVAENNISQLYIKMQDEAYAEMKERWTAAKTSADSAVNQAGILLLAGLLAFIYLLWTAGKQPQDEYVHMLLIDRMYVELDLGLLIGSIVGTVALFFVFCEEAWVGGGSIPAILYRVMALLAAAEAGLCLLFILAIVRNLKNHSFVQRSLILAAVKFCWRLAVKVILWAWNLVKRIFWWTVSALRTVWHALGDIKETAVSGLFKNYKTRNVVLLFLAYSAALFILAMMFGVMVDYGEGVIVFLCALVLFGISTAFLIKRVEGFESICQGIAKIRGGQLDYKITDCPAGVMRTIAEDMNYIGEGLSKSLENEIRAERMKSELITNVSHDLKTPLTSIINYADLLCQEELKPEEANDYAAIIKQKGQRLKNLTADLFDISKVQSGTETIAREQIDMNLLLKQALGEFDSNIKASSLQFHTTLPEREVLIIADGKKLSRVFENLIGNCLKYTLENTRVYLSLKEADGEARAEIKNIANYAMDFDEEEITERFVRGDAARSTEGSGLGLAIAKSYVEAMGGILQIRRDGDLFKVLLTFKTVVPHS